MSRGSFIISRESFIISRESFPGDPPIPVPSPALSSVPEMAARLQLRSPILFLLQIQVQNPIYFTPLLKETNPFRKQIPHFGVFFAQKAEFLDILTYLELLALARWHMLGKQCCGVSFILIFNFFFLQPKKKLRKQDLEMEEQGKSIPGTGDLGKKTPKNPSQLPGAGDRSRDRGSFVASLSLCSGNLCQPSPFVLLSARRS